MPFYLGIVLNDGMSWGVFPLLFVANKVSLEGVGLWGMLVVR